MYPHHIAWLLLLALPVVVHAASFQETWDDGNEFSGWTFEKDCKPYNFRIVDDPTRKGNQVVRIENRLEPCDGRSRVELHVNNMSKPGVPYGEDFWWRFRMYIPRDWTASTMPVGWLTVAQIIPGNNTLGFTPDWKLTIRRDHVWNWDGPDGKRLGSVTRGAWTEWLIRHKRSTGNDGLTEVWMNGEKVINYRGKTTFADIPMAMWKFGIYGSASTRRQTHVLYFDDIVTGDKELSPSGTEPPSPEPPSHLHRPRG